jgi:mannitol operon transcriptional antiterminator
MYINNRLLKVAEFLKNKDETTIKETAETLKISEKAVRYEVDKLNFILAVNNFPEIEKKSKGRLISREFSESYDEKVFLELINRDTKNDRKEYIKLRFLLDEKINFSHMSDELDVSRTTVKNDMSEIEEEIKKEGVNLKKNYKDTEETDRRNYILKNYKENINKFFYMKKTESGLIDTFVYNELSGVDMNMVRNFLNKISEEIENRDNNFYEYIFSYLIVAYMRIRRGHLIENIKNKSFLKNTEEYELVSGQIEMLEKSFRVSYGEIEILQLVDYILGFISYGYNTTIFENWIEIKLLVQEIISEVSNYTDIDITSDEELFNGLLNHIKPVIYRMKNGLGIEEEIYYEAIKAYPELFEIVKKALKRLEELIGKKIDNSEIALFTIHFLASIERKRNFSNKYKNVLLVCGGGYGTSMLVGKKLEENYDIDIKATLSYMELPDYNFENVDMIISTLTLNEHLTEKIKLPIVKISAFFTVEDQEKLNLYLVKKNSYREKMNKVLELIEETDIIRNNRELEDKLRLIINDEDTVLIRKEKRLADFIQEDRVQIIDRVESWQESIEICGRPLIEKNEIKKEYVDEIINIAELFGVHFILENNVAIPHGEVFKNVNKSCISVLSIRNSVIFPGNRKVFLMFLIGAANITEHVKSIEEIINLTQKKDLLEKIKQIDNSAELYKFFKSLNN